MKHLILVFTLMSSGFAFGGTKEFDSAMEPILQQYLAIQSALASDNIDGVKQAAAKIKADAAKLNSKSVTGEHASHYKDVPSNLLKSASAISEAKDINAARDSFKELSQPIAMWAGMSKPKGVDLVYCPMAKASWIQKTGSVKNPYFGAKMLQCGEVVK